MAVVNDKGHPELALEQHATGILVALLPTTFFYSESISTIRPWVKTQVSGSSALNFGAKMAVFCVKPVGGDDG